MSLTGVGCESRECGCVYAGARVCYELYPYVNTLYQHKTEVLRVMWLQDADEVAKGVFAREDIETGTFLLDFGELRLATAIESSDQLCGWRLRFDIESKLSTVTKTFVVKDADRSLGDGGGRGMSKGGKVNSTCYCVHKKASSLMLNWCRTAQGYACFVRTTRQVRVDSEMLVINQSDRGTCMLVFVSARTIKRHHHRKIPCQHVAPFPDGSHIEN
jgi:hypothetical protein